MELTNIKGNTWMIAGPVNIGLYVENNEVVLIDSGNDSSAGRKILRLIEAKGWTIRWIVNTHSHADHIGGNAFIQKRTECGIAAPKKESPFINHPELEPFFLWSGNAPAGLRNKFLQAEASNVTRTFNEGDVLEGFGVQAVGLPGHMIDQIGVRTPDNVLFLADTVLSERILEKYGVPFVADYDAAIATFERMMTFEASLYVPSHGEVTDTIGALIAANRACLEALRSEILDICAIPVSRDAALAELSRRHSIELNLGQYALLFSSLSSILTALIERNDIACAFSSGTLQFQKKD